MRRLGPLLLALALLIQVNTGMAQTVTPAAAPKPVAAAEFDWKPIAIGLGAIAGVVVFNATAIGWQALPGGLGLAAGATVPAEASVAISRVYATASAVIGAWIAYYAYGTSSK